MGMEKKGALEFASLDAALHDSQDRMNRSQCLELCECLPPKPLSYMVTGIFRDPRAWDLGCLGDQLPGRDRLLRKEHLTTSVRCQVFPKPNSYQYGYFPLNTLLDRL